LIAIVLCSSIPVSLRSAFWGSTAGSRLVLSSIADSWVQSTQSTIARLAAQSVASLLVHLHRRRQLFCLQLVATGGRLQMMDKAGHL